MAKKEQEKKKASQEESQDIAEKEQNQDGNPYLETNIDKLYKVVNKRKSINFIQASEEFDVPKEQIASWAKILEDHKLAKVHYPVFGTPVILAKEAENKNIFSDEDAPKKKSPKKGPKIMLVMIAAGAIMFLGIIMAVNNPTMLGLRSQINSLAARLFSPFNFLRYPLNIIIPIAIIIAVIWAVFSVRRKKHARKEDEKRELAEEEKSTEGDEEKPSRKKESAKAPSEQGSPSGKEDDGEKASKTPSGKEGKPKKEEPPKETKEPREERKPKKRPDEIQDRIQRIREKLDS